MKIKNLKQKFIINIEIISAVLIILCTVLGFGYYKESTDNKETLSKTTYVDTDEKDDFYGMEVINDDRGVPIICYHSVTDNKRNESSISIYKEIFRKHLEALKDEGYSTLTIDELDNYLEKNKPIPEKSVVITFDDGYVDNYVNAYEILKEFNMKATMFMISENVNKPGWMTSDQLKEMSNNGISIESHTINHKELADLSYNEQLYELKESKKTLEKILNKPVNEVAYPCGSYDDNTLKATKQAGYKLGFTIARGRAKRNDDLKKINRNCIDYTYSKRDIIKLLKKF